MSLLKKSLLGLASFVAFVVIIGLFWLLKLYGEMEAYCFFYPAIDTTYASDYSEAAFDQLRNGASPEHVTAALGKPLSTHTNQIGQVEWWYTRDGKCWWGDFAWLGRAVIFQEGTMTQSVKQIFYD